MHGRSMELVKPCMFVDRSPGPVLLFSLPSAQLLLVHCSYTAYYCAISLASTYQGQQAIGLVYLFIPASLLALYLCVFFSSSFILLSLGSSPPAPCRVKGSQDSHGLAPYVWRSSPAAQKTAGRSLALCPPSPCLLACSCSAGGRRRWNSNAHTCIPLFSQELAACICSEVKPRPSWVPLPQQWGIV